MVFLLVIIICMLYGCVSDSEKYNPKEEPIAEFSTPIFEDIEIEESIPVDDEEKEVRYDRKFYTKVSCAVTPDLDITTVLLELARQCGICIGIASNIDIKAAIVATDKPFISVLKDVCEMCDLRYTINGTSVKIEKDLPYFKTYDLQFLNVTRETNIEIATANDTLSTLNGQNSTDGQKANKDNGSSSLVKGIGKTDFWAELESNLKMILGGESKAKEAVTFHRQGGIVTITANSKQHQFIKKYIDLLKKTTECQVLIEAKILEVGLLDQYRGGIDWSSAPTSQLHLSMTPVASMGTNDGLTALSVGYNGKNFQSILKYIEKFGTIRTLSNPRITVMNNQPAVMKVAKNEIITRPSLYRQFSSNFDSRNTDAMSVDIQTIPIGIIFTVHPSIDIARREITLTVRPTLSRVVEQREVDVYSYTSNGVGQGGTATPQKITIPIVEVRELDSVLKLKSGQVVVMGGIMQEISKYNRIGLPGANSQPVLNAMFNAKENNSMMTELVVFLRARILDKNKKQHIVHKKDIANLTKYTHDPRPFTKEAK